MAVCSTLACICGSAVVSFSPLTNAAIPAKCGGDCSHGPDVLPLKLSEFCHQLHQILSQSELPSVSVKQRALTLHMHSARGSDAEGEGGLAWILRGPCPSLTQSEVAPLSLNMSFS